MEEDDLNRIKEILIRHHGPFIQKLNKICVSDGLEKCVGDKVKLWDNSFIVTKDGEPLTEEESKSIIGETLIVAETGIKDNDFEIPENTAGIMKMLVELELIPEVFKKVISERGERYFYKRDIICWSKKLNKLIRTNSEVAMFC